MMVGLGDSIGVCLYTNLKSDQMLPACCARCGKRFRNTTRALLHMNQPLSSCRIEFENRLKRSRRRREQHSERHLPTEPDTSPAETFHGAETHQDFRGNLNTPEVDGEIGMRPPSDTAPYFTEFYPGAAETYGHGQTFMDRFDADEFSCHRDELPYYPFASQNEWGLASFLLRSDLSMSVLDEYFKLATVSDHCHTDTSLKLGFVRSNLLVYPSDQQRHYEISLSSSHLGRNGNVKRWRLGGLPRKSSDSSIETPLNAYKRF